MTISSKTIMMKGIFFAFLLSNLSNYAYSAAGDMTISNMAGPWPITIKTCSYDAGAICSLTWRGKEFINDTDHGRQLQSASSFDGLGEAFNPTEAGSVLNGSRPNPSSSMLTAYWSTSSVLATKTQMAFWKPVDNKKTSDHYLLKHVSIGAYGLAHVIEYLTQFQIPSTETHAKVTFEVLTGYMPPEFSKFWTYDVTSGVLSELSDGPGEQSLPIIFSTPDEKWAMGIYAPKTAQPTSYGRWRFNNANVVKWNNVYRYNNPQGSYAFRSYVIVGSLENVKVSMTQLYGILKK